MSRSSFIVVTAVIAFGGFLMGRSSSDDKENPPDRRGAEGRFQLVATPHTFIVFDTRTARGWAIGGNAGYPDATQAEWTPISSPFQR